MPISMYVCVLYSYKYNNNEYLSAFVIVVGIKYLNIAAHI